MKELPRPLARLALGATLLLWALRSRAAWRRELVWVAGLLLLAGTAFVSGSPGWSRLALAGLAAYALRQFLLLLRLGRWLNGSGTLPAVRGGWGEVLGGIARLQRTGRKRKRKLTRALRRFNEATDALPDAAVALGPRGEIEWWNPTAERLLGLQRGIDHGQRITDLMRHPEFGARMRSGDWATALELPSRADERVWLSVRVVTLSKKRRLLLARDITRLRRLEEMRRDFVANVSHELRTPLTVMSGYVEALLETEAGGNPARERALKRMQEQTRRMQTLVADLLHLSRLELDQKGRQLEPCPVAGVVDGVYEEALGLSGGRHRVELEQDRGLGLLCQPDELRSAFSNLVSNAVRYTPEGGSIRIRWYRDGNGEACFAVTDSGTGIDPVHLPRLTERFYRVDVGRSRETGGTGLGLAIVKHVLTHHDGRLTVESEPGRGSTFTCRFPAGRAVRLGGGDEEADGAAGPEDDGGAA
ncbi:phosphate regulon sensor histidine kinase PhoR [Thioalbus denitrificans]|uniref:phosphate regulon sensor histidine kinase PhoR n=1 Tax=Thioalbus denitrificans TaxID=547122 RepID=UPI001B86DAE7|nr:phosphate regulon sensor histidine kinase PhoR [Thioalbus denitrificans]